MHRVFALTVALAVVGFGQRAAAQDFTFSLFERYLESLREQVAIPGMSGLVLQDGVVVWEKHFGRQDLENGISPRGDTPYLIGDLSQIFGSTLLLKECVEENGRALADPVTDWNPGFPDPEATLVHLLAHVQPDGSYKQDLGRFAALTPITESCANRPYQLLLAEEVFTRLGLADSVPGSALAAPTLDEVETFTEADLARYADILRRMATPYAVDIRGNATRNEVPRLRVNAATGVVTTVRDLARFDAALPHDVLLERATQIAAWTRVAPHLPTGLGWYVQNYNGNAVVWQFGRVAEAYSSLILKIPNRGLTFILLANSDGLSAPFALEKGDVTSSLFARLFLRLYVP